jgi:hypothetical protein
MWRPQQPLLLLLLEVQSHPAALRARWAPRAQLVQLLHHIVFKGLSTDARPRECVNASLRIRVRF